MKLLAGTSGYAFKEWKGTFYPAGLGDDERLGYYASRFPAVEINNTFYRLPRPEVLRQWASQVPEHFTFAIKASQHITHFARIGPSCERAVDILLRNVELLGDRMGPILFQLPADLEKDLQRLRGFLGLLPPGDNRRYSIEFRHQSWFDDEVFETLRARNVALCIADLMDFSSPVWPTATWGYVRLHRTDYDDSTLGRWGRCVSAQDWSEAYVFFKHDEGIGSGPPAVDAFSRALS